MDLLDSYLQSVRQAMFFIPADQKRDILAELSEALRSDVDAKERELGRSLGKNELGAILARYGNPLLVAGRYRNSSLSLAFGRQIVGPELFPIYAAVLAINIVTTLVAAVSLMIAAARVTVGSLFMPFLVQFTIVTVIFAAIDYSARRSVWGGWQMLTAAPPDPYRFPRLSSTVEIIFLFLTLQAWLQTPYPGWTAGSTWVDFRTTYFIPMLLIIVALLATAIFNLIRPYWTARRLLFRIVINTAFGLMLLHKSYVHRWQLADRDLNAVILWTFMIMAVAVLGQALYDVVRYIRLKKQSAADDGGAHVPQNLS